MCLLLYRRDLAKVCVLLVYLAFFDTIMSTDNSVVVVLSPLIAIMKDQVILLTLQRLLEEHYLDNINIK